MNFLDTTFSFDVENMGAAGCGTNIALYGVLFQDFCKIIIFKKIFINNFNFQQVQLSSVNFGEYCDANGVGGKWCAEMDFFEANAHALHTTPHCCCEGPCKGTNGD